MAKTKTSALCGKQGRQNISHFNLAMVQINLPDCREVSAPQNILKMENELLTTSTTMINEYRDGGQGLFVCEAMKPINRY